MEGVTLDSIRDSVVSANTTKAYIGDITSFLSWVVDFEPDWLTDYGKSQLANCFCVIESEKIRARQSRIQISLKNLLRDSFTHPIIFLERINPARYMSFILTLRKSNGKYHSTSAFGNKRAALFHLFRCHNRIGFDNNFKTELGNLFKGLFREITQADPTMEGDFGVQEEVSNKEGKGPMSVELYKKICEWLLKYGTVDGVFAYCYLVFTWNLSCRVVNTARVRYSEINWSESFDSFSVHFSHSKTDQLGEEAKYARHLYSNPLCPIVCPVLALSLYLTSCFNKQQQPNGYLFPGNQQESRFSSLLLKVVEENWASISKMGYKRGDIGTHSIRKGAVSYLASLPGGPPAAATCIRAGWTMGKVKDIYMRYVVAGDEFVGRCLCLLSLLRTDFGVSPPHFILEDEPWIEPIRALQFPMFGLIAGFKKITTMCLASILFHREWLLLFLPSNHVFLITSYVHRLASLTSKIEKVRITFPWNDKEKAFSGVPPQMSLLYEVTELKDRQQGMVVELVEEIKKLLEDMSMDGGRLTEQNLRKILGEFQEAFTSKINTPTTLEATVDTELEGGRAEAGKRYLLHVYSDGMKKVPPDWRFPRCGVFDLWRQWWIGDTVRNIPPLRFLKPPDVCHLHSLEIGEEEKHGRTGKDKDKRRDPKKTLSDMAVLMKMVKEKVSARGEWAAVITPDSVAEMFRKVEDEFKGLGKRDSQVMWTTVLKNQRAKKN
jgi:hypothetical protein